MTSLTKEEQDAHFNATAKGAISGGIAGATVGLIGISAASARFPAFRQMRAPIKTSLVIMPAAFAGFVTAEKYSRNYLFSQHHGLLFGEQFKDTASRMHDEAVAQKSTIGKLREWATVYRFPILGVSWVTSLAVAGILVSRDRNLTRTQKFGQARIYAQGLTVALVLALAGFTLGKDDEGKWDTVLVADPDDPEHKRMIEKKNLRERYKGQHLWKDMVEQEERKMKEREDAMREQHERDVKAGKVRHKKHKHHKEKKHATHDQEETIHDQEKTTHHQERTTHDQEGTTHDQEGTTHDQERTSEHEFSK